MFNGDLNVVDLVGLGCLVGPDTERGIVPLGVDRLCLPAVRVGRVDEPVLPVGVVVAVAAEAALRFVALGVRETLLWLEMDKLE